MTLRSKRVVCPSNMWHYILTEIHTWRHLDRVRSSIDLLGLEQTDHASTRDHSASIITTGIEYNIYNQVIGTYILCNKRHGNLCFFFLLHSVCAPRDNNITIRPRRVSQIDFHYVSISVSTHTLQSNYGQALFYLYYTYHIIIVFEARRSSSPLGFFHVCSRHCIIGIPIQYRGRPSHSPLLKTIIIIIIIKYDYYTHTASPVPTRHTHVSVHTVRNLGCKLYDPRHDTTIIVEYITWHYYRIL